MSQILVSPAPHWHSKDTTTRLMRDVLIALTPSVLVALYFAGWSALMVFAVSVLGCMGVEYLIARFFMHKPCTIGDLSAAVTGVLLALNLPASSPWWMILIGCVVAIGIAKMTFGGLGNNLFNPALVARVFLLISFPVQMTTWTVKSSWFTDAFSGATPLGVVKEGLAGGQTMDAISSQFDFSYMDLFMGRMDGSLGEASILALLIGFIYLLARKVILPHIPFTILITAAAFSTILWLVNPLRFPNPLFTILTGGLVLGAVFMATDYVTSPMTPKGMIIYGVGIGILVVLIRDFGSYPEGMSFAILLMNACVPLINKMCKPAQYQKEVSRG